MVSSFFSLSISEEVTASELENVSQLKKKEKNNWPDNALVTMLKKSNVTLTTEAPFIIQELFYFNQSDLINFNLRKCNFV